MRSLTKHIALFALAALAATLFFVMPGVMLERKIIYLTGALGLCLWCRTLWTFIFNRVAFDWQMINGWFLLKVICLAVLTPSLIAIPIINLGITPETLTHDSTMFGDSPEVVDLPSIIWSVYYHFIDPGNQHLAITAESRMWAAILGVAGVFLLNGLLVSSLIGWVDRRKERWMSGDISYSGFLRTRMHHIIIGGNEMVEGIIHHIFDNHPKRSWRIWRPKLPWIVIQTTSDVDELRRKLCAELSIARQKHLIICHGSRTSKQELAELAPATAEQIFILGEEARIDDLESCHDTLNMECLKLIASLSDRPSLCRLISGADERIACRVMFEYQTSYAALKVSDINTEIISVTPFNPYEMWAQRMLVGKEMLREDYYRYLPLEGSDGIKANDETRAHLIIIGMSRMGVALGIEAAHLSHFPNFATNGVRTRITFIDSNAEQEMAFFKGRFEHLFKLSRWRYAKSPELCSPCEKTTNNTPLYARSGDESWHKPGAAVWQHLGGDFIDVEWEFIHGNVESESVRQYLTDAVNEPDQRTTVAVCLPIHNRALAEALHLPNELFRKAQQVLVYQRNNDCSLREIALSNARYQHKLKPFGLTAKALDFELLSEIDSVARKVGEAYNAHMGYPPKPAEAKGWRDFVRSLAKVAKHLICRHSTATAADSTPAEGGKSNASKLWSNRYNAYSLRSKCRCVGLIDPLKADANFTPEQIEILSQVEHNRWNIEQLLLGFAPLDLRSQQDYLKGAITKDELKEQFLHLDICSNERLKEIDPDSPKIDQALVACLPQAVRYHYGICTNEECGQESTTQQDATAEPQPSTSAEPAKSAEYTPSPLDTSDVELPAELDELVEIMAKNVHEVWAQSRINEGWSLGAVRNEKRKEHPCLVEYEQLPESERDYDRNTAIGTLKLILKYGAKITPPKR